MSDPVWFWQRIVSPHMAGLAAALAAAGREVIYVAESPMSADRAEQGWQVPDLGSAKLRLMPGEAEVLKLVNHVPSHSIHICQGFRGNGMVGVARNALANRGLRQWVVMETVDDSGWCAALKRLEYARLIRLQRNRIEGILAIGHATSAWLEARGMTPRRTFPFAYFLPDHRRTIPATFNRDAPFRLLFVGQFIERKRLDLLIDALALIEEPWAELVVAGSGPLEWELRKRAEAKLGSNFRWLGVRPQAEISSLMTEADCLVLPSRYDGWGAVVSEALMAGTPAVCSNRCGSAGVVQASGRGGVFPTGELAALATLLRATIAEGRQTPEQRTALVSWASCIGALAGAEYLTEILRYQHTMDGDKPKAPWLGGHGRSDARP